MVESTDFLFLDAWLSPFCEDIFSSFARADQRRWGDVYLQGLLTVPGRKSIRRISDQVVGRPVDQCLQQFVNQSPWDWQPVRRRLAGHLAAAFRAKAWVVEEVAFPKNGANSVGVARQFAHSAGRLINCQLGLAVMLVGESGGCPVNWRLLLPRSWDDDPARRARTRIPAHERYRSRWDHLLEAIDEMVLDWGLSPAPVVVDARVTPRVEPLLRGLEERGLHYVARVGETALLRGRAAGWAFGAENVASAAGAACAVQGGRNGTTLSGRGRDKKNGSRLTAIPLDVPAGPVELRPRRPAQRFMTVEWAQGKSGPKAMWLTDLGDSRLSEVADMIDLRRNALAQLALMDAESGLRHFEGRSFRGWHHHVTLVSAAHGYRLLRGLDGELAHAGPGGSRGSNG
ncbi:transposase [Sphaerisporangium sp. NPDC051011]|uniref:IS701 family transposase n=1 Tax=Sphaerisporangium sp. NPDC051011 TaxID=3155792 RepID=UPI0033D787AF